MIVIKTETTMKFKSNKPLRQYSIFLLLILIPLLSNAHNKVVVVPLFSDPEFCLDNGQDVPVPFTNPSIQPSIAVCQAQCFLGTSSPEPRCCGKAAGSLGTNYNNGTQVCDCFLYRCRNP